MGFVTLISHRHSDKNLKFDYRYHVQEAQFLLRKIMKYLGISSLACKSAAHKDSKIVFP